MRKAILLLCLVLLVPMVSSGQSPSINYYPAGGGLAGLTSSGTAITSTVPILLPDATNTTPALCFAGDNDGTCAGWYREAGNMWTLTNGSGGNPGNYRFAPTYFNFAPQQFGLGGNIGAPYVIINAEAANTLALRNNTNAQTFNIYNTYTDGSNYERGEFLWSSNELKIGTRSAGTGSTRGLQLAPANSTVTFANASYVKFFNIENNTKAAYPETSDDFSIGYSTKLFNNAYVSRSIQGSKTRALTESSDTEFVRVAVPQSGFNFAGGEVIYTVYATDATDTQTLDGSLKFGAINKAGTETCQIEDDQNASPAVSAGTLTCTMTCVTGMADVIGLAANCVSSLSQSVFTIYYRLNMPQPQTVSPQ